MLVAIGTHPSKQIPDDPQKILPAEMLVFPGSRLGGDENEASRQKYRASSKALLMKNKKEMPFAT